MDATFECSALTAATAEGSGKPASSRLARAFCSPAPVRTHQTARCSSRPAVHVHDGPTLTRRSHAVWAKRAGDDALVHSEAWWGRAGGGEGAGAGGLGWRVGRGSREGSGGAQGSPWASARGLYCGPGEAPVGIAGPRDCVACPGLSKSAQCAPNAFYDVGKRFGTVPRI